MEYGTTANDEGFSCKPKSDVVIARFIGASICIPSRYDNMSPLKMTLKSLKESGATEWFQNSIRGRRKGEELEWITTLHNIQADTKVEGAIPYNLRWEVNPEDIKTKLRELAAAE